MIWLQLTANTGPAECCLAVTKAVTALHREAAAAQVQLSAVDEVRGRAPGTFFSVLLKLEGDNAEVLAKRWCGTILWICTSPYRLHHRRKNWFLSGAIFHPVPPLPESAVVFKTTRASGPGGQHVNTSDTAVIAIHTGTGVSVRVQTERSQHQNKVLAAELLASKVAALEEAEQNKGKADRRMHHYRAERGNACRVFVGPDFIERLK
jgi:peptide chain release factor